MKLYHITAIADEVVHADADWTRAVYWSRACDLCGYIASANRAEPLDIVLSTEPRDNASKLFNKWTGGGAMSVTGPYVGVWSVVADLVRCDLIEDLKLATGGCLLGEVRLGNTVLKDYRSVVMHPGRWVLGFSRPLAPGRPIMPCHKCNRLGWNAGRATEHYVVRESMAREGDSLKGLYWPDVYDFNGVNRLLITDRAVGRIRPSVLDELTLTEVKIIRFNDIDLAAGTIDIHE